MSETTSKVAPEVIVHPEIQQLLAVVEEIAALRPEVLVREDMLGKEFNFSSGLSLFRQINSLCQQLKKANYHDMPRQKLQQLLQFARQLQQLIKNLQEFSVQGNPAAAITIRDNILNEMRNQYASFYNVAILAIANAQLDTTIFEEKIRTLVEDAIREREEISRLKQEVQLTLIEARKLSREVGIVPHAAYFKQAAETSDIWQDMANCNCIAFCMYSYCCYLES